ncbi:MAG: UbiA family prenyltransferase [Halobacteriota archaeon]|nr:UbiA family prenyltransferase [Halobacteriota archaeon]
MVKKKPALVVGIIQLCVIPSATLYFYPLFSIVLFIIAKGYINPLVVSRFYPLLLGVGIALLSNFGTNIWNHSNDIKEDMAQGKDNVLTQGIVNRRTIVTLATIFYMISLMVIFILSERFNRPIFPFFLIWCVITWWYSDNFFFKKIFGFRLKDHYLGELVTYIIACPTFTLSIWLIYTDMDIRGLSLALIFLFYGISGLLLKDLKDITGDRAAGLKTLGVVFLPSQLLFLSSMLLILYYLLIITFTLLEVFNIGSLLVSIPLAIFISGTFLYFHRKSWELEKDDYKPIQNMMLTTYASLFMFGIGNFI